jgi:hypothetical protein
MAVVGVVVVAGIVVVICCIVVVAVGVWQGVGRIDRCLTVQSYCRERAGLDFDLLGYPSRPAAQAPPFPHHQYSHHHNDQHVRTMNVSTMTIPAALAPPLPTSYI